MRQTSSSIVGVTVRKVAEREELEPFTGTVVIIDDHPIALFNFDGEYFAIDNTCPHLGGSLGDGEVEGEVVTCPWHGWEFNYRSGKAVENPRIKVKKYTILLKEDGVYIEWPERETV